MDFHAKKEDGSKEKTTRVMTSAGVTDVRAAAAAAAAEYRAAQTAAGKDGVNVALEENSDAVVCSDCAPSGGYSMINKYADDDEDSVAEEDKAPADRLIIPSDVIPITDTDETIQIVGTRGEKVTKIAGLDGCTVLKNLVLRACLISKIEGIEQLQCLEKLELYDNQILAISGVETLSNLKILDLSFNCIRTMAPVSQCPQLEEIYIAQNKLRKIEGLEGLAMLRVLDLGANRIRVMEGLNHCTNLKSLWLGKNKIERIEGIDSLSLLAQLDVQSNRLLEIGEGLNNLPVLSELYLAHNRIPDVSKMVLSNPSSLNTIDLSGNPIVSVAGMELNKELEECWLSSTALSSFEAISPLSDIPTLSCIYLEHSPVAKLPGYKQTLQSMVPTLTQLDALLVASLR